jgi:hypothetical protein
VVVGGGDDGDASLLAELGVASQCARHVAPAERGHETRSVELRAAPKAQAPARHEAPDSTRSCPR